MFIAVAIAALSSCGSSESPPREQSGGQIKLATKQEITDSDFIFRLVTEKAEYKLGEDVNLYAEIEYVGEQRSIKIYHAASPFYFDLHETTRNIQIPYAMNEPLIETVLKKAQPYREQYKKTGGFSEQDSKKFQQFMKQFLENDEFPLGNYVVNGTADFFIRKNDGEVEMYKLKGEVGFQINE